jgi:hypothetical protein
MSSNLQSYEFFIEKDNLEEILKCIADLSKINPMVKVKLDEDDVLFYSRAGTDMTIPAFKSFQYPIANFIRTLEPQVLDFIVLNGSNFVKNCALFLDKDEEIAGKLMYNQNAKVANQLYLTNEKLNFNFISGDYTQIKDITKTQIAERMNPDNSNFSFTMSGDVFAEIKKLVTLNKSEVINIRTKKGKLEFYDKRWSLKVADVQVDDDLWTFNNKYLKSIDASDEIKINMFDQFLLIKENNVNLMIGLELSSLK